MAYCKPWNTGLASEPRAVAKQLSQLLQALESTTHIAQGDMGDELRAFRLNLIDKLQADGWSVEPHGKHGKWIVRPPKPKLIVEES